MSAALRLARLFDRAVDVLVLRIVLPAASLVLVAALLVMAAEIVSRYLVGSSLVWSEELARYALIWSTMLGAAVAYHQAESIAVTALLESFPRLGRQVLTPVIHAATLSFGIVLVAQGWALTARNFARGQMTTALEVPIAWVNLAIPVGGALLALVAVAGLLRGRATFRPPRVGD
jgi:TRAP-type C4-dicarboxylate transport system permease small subunit